MSQEQKKRRYNGILITAQELKDLQEYSCSEPTGIYIGKTWKRRRNYYNEKDGYVIGRYEASEDPTKYFTRWYVPLIVDGPKALRGVGKDGQPLNLREQMKREREGRRA